MAFTFWQRFYPSLLGSIAAWGGLAYWYVNAAADQKFGITMWAYLVALCLVFALIKAATDQIKFRIRLNRAHRFRQQAAQGQYTDRVRL